MTREPINHRYELDRSPAPLKAVRERWELWVHPGGNTMLGPSSYFNYDGWADADWWPFVAWPNWVSVPAGSDMAAVQDSARRIFRKPRA